MSDKTSEQTANLTTALGHAANLLASNSASAEEQAREILRVVPGHPQALLLLGSALRRQGKAADARTVLQPLAASQPKAPMVQFEWGLLLGSQGESREAISALTRAVRLNPKLAGAWRELGDALTLAGDAAAADKAYAQHINASVNDRQLLDAATALYGNKLAIAERLLRAFLKEHPTDVTAIRMLAEAGSRLGRYEDAENLLARCLELAPSFHAARHNYASVLYRENKAQQAIAEINALIKIEPRNPAYLALKAAALGQIGEYGEAVANYEKLLKDFPRQPKAFMSYGHTLKALGRQEQCIAAYRRSIELLPSLGEAYWSLANLKTLVFSQDDISAMRAQLARDDLSDEDRYHFEFALGKALEDERDYAQAFAHYENGNSLRQKSTEYDAEKTADNVARLKSLFTRGFFATHGGGGSEAADPIFIVGLPRAGSTLLEQILSSHSKVEGTMELPDIVSIARRLRGRRDPDDPLAYPQVLATMDGDMMRSLGEEYLDRSRIHRKLGRPFFIDKMPNNFMHIGLIHLILPRARIIDARRHPLACCFSCYKQHFARGQTFSYGLADIGRYYADYVELMAHFDGALPGRIHRVIYEEMVSDPEREVRRLLEHCGLAFEEGCLRFYENDRAVRTASSEQVRRPIFREGLDQWRRFEPWLGPLREALGPVLEAYPGVPDF